MKIFMLHKISFSKAEPLRYLIKNFIYLTSSFIQNLAQKQTILLLDCIQRPQKIWTATTKIWTFIYEDFI